MQLAAINPQNIHLQLAPGDEQIEKLPLRDGIGRRYGIGEDGSIVFGAYLKNGRHALFVADGRGLRTLAKTSPDGYTNLLITSDLGLTDRNDVLFSAEMGPSRKVLVRATGQGDEILAENTLLIDSNRRGTTLYSKGPDLHLRVDGREMRIGAVGGAAALSESDIVAYWNGESITRWRDGGIMPEETPPPRLLAGWVRTDHPLKVNRAGSYVMLTALPQVPNGQSLLLRSEGRSIRIADNADESGERSGQAFSRFVRADINDRNEVAFVARMNNSTMAAFVFRDGRIHALSGLRTVGGGVDDIAINSSGVAIYGDLTGLWSGPDLNADRIIGRGDTLLGKQVQLVRLLGLNEAGQIFFTVGFRGSSVFTSLVRADPR